MDAQLHDSPQVGVDLRVHDGGTTQRGERRRNRVTTAWRSRLFEDVAINPGVLLAVDDNVGVPGPHVLDLFAVLDGVELGEVVALPVRGDIEGREVLLTTDHVDTTGEAVVVDTIDGVGTEDVLARGLKTGLETT